ncbi:MAG: hypothetical protein IJ816_04815 [Alloprevotella sp.]|nr:hypothetical protein [Alloprevotella sp.]
MPTFHARKRTRKLNLCTEEHAVRRPARYTKGLEPAESFSEEDNSGPDSPTTPAPQANKRAHEVGRADNYLLRRPPATNGPHEVYAGHTPYTSDSPKPRDDGQT